MIKKLLAFAIIFLFIGSNFVSGTNIQLKNTTNPLISGHGNTLYVGGNGPGNYTTIQSAINDAVDGDTILVYSGTYNEYIRIIKQLFIKGIKKLGEDYPTINGGNDYDTVIIYIDGCSFEDFIVRNGPGGFNKKAITLQSNNNIVMNCTTFNTGRGIFLLSSSNNVIAHNKVCYGGAYGLYLDSSCNNTFFGNDIYDFNNFGILFSANSNNNWFYNNSVHDCSHNPAFKIEGSVENVISGNNISNSYNGLIIESCRNTIVIENIFINDGIIISGTIDEMTSNIFENNLINGRPYYFYGNKNGITVPEDAGQIFLVNCSNCIIKNCNITRVDYGIQLLCSSDNTIINNDIRGTDPAGITLSQSHDNLISGNYINGCREGILLGSSDRNIISNNTVADHPYHLGIGIRSSNKNTVFNNKIFNSRTGLVLTGNDNIISKNNISYNDYAGVCICGSNNVISGNYIYLSSHFGIYLEGFGVGNKNTITLNHILMSGKGIYITEASNHIISKNNIANNDVGIFLTASFFNYISKNNLKNNNCNAYFDIFLLSNANIWRSNYWDDWSGIGPYKIKGIKAVIVGWDEYGFPIFKDKEIYNFDWNPVKEPYNIPVKINIFIMKI